MHHLISYPHAEHTQKFLLSKCSVHAEVPDAYAQCTHQFLTHMLSGQCTQKFLKHMLSARISSLRICSACFEGNFARCTHKYLIRKICLVHAEVPDAYAQCTHKFLMLMLTHKGQSKLVSLQMFLIIFIVSKKLKFKKSLLTPTNGHKSYLIPHFFWQTQDKVVLKNLAEHTRKELCAPKWTLNNFSFILYFSPKVARQRDFMV
jgi:hypothetical protein